MIYCIWVWRKKISKIIYSNYVLYKEERKLYGPKICILSGNLLVYNEIIVTDFLRIEMTKAIISSDVRLLKLWSLTLWQFFYETNNDGYDRWNKFGESDFVLPLWKRWFAIADAKCTRSSTNRNNSIEEPISKIKRVRDISSVLLINGNI